MLHYLKNILRMLLITYCIEGNAEIMRRAAFDFGSGEIKLQVADVDTENHSIFKPIYAHATSVLLSDDAANHPKGCFSDKIQECAIAAAQSLKERAVELGAVEFAGLATEAYRRAPNGTELIDKYKALLNIPVKIISQIEEGKVGFLALIAETKLDPATVISWDIGGGSFQVTYLDDERNTQVYMAPFGRMTTKNAIIKFVKGEDPSKVFSPNPMSRSEWERSLDYFALALPQVPESLVLKLKRADVQLIGMAAHPKKFHDLRTYHLGDVLENLEERLNKSDAELANINNPPATGVTELALVYSVMHKFDVTSVNYMRTSSGSTSGLLIAEEYWDSDFNR